jgi:hypothetical protein
MCLLGVAIVHGWRRVIPREGREAVDDCWESLEVFVGASGELRCRLVVGYALLGGELYHVQKLGAVIPMTAAECEQAYGGDWGAYRLAVERRLTEKAQQSWLEIPTAGTIEYPLYAWQLGAPYEMDDDEEVVGIWPPIATLTLRYTHVFLMPAGRLPAAEQHRHLWRWPVPEPVA